MNLQQLRYIVAVAEYGTITRAAQTLHMGQPALTQAIRALERELGAELFERTSRGLILTDAGRVLVAGATRALDELGDAVDRVRALGTDDQPVLRLVARPAAAHDPGVELIARLRAARPHVLVRVELVESVDEATDLLFADGADFALTDPVGDLAGLVSCDVAVHRFVALLPPGARASDPIGWDALATYPMIGTARSDRRWRAVDAAFLGAGAAADVVVEVNRRELVLPLVAAGVGACIGYEHQRAEAERLGITCVTLEPDRARPVTLVRQQRTLPPHVEECWALITAGDTAPSPI
jgi:DNA-binding transcriptional LysR family regulator